MKGMEQEMAGNGQPLLSIIAQVFVINMLFISSTVLEQTHKVCKEMLFFITFCKAETASPVISLTVRNTFSRSGSRGPIP